MEEKWILIWSSCICSWNPPEITSEDTVFLKILTIKEVCEYLIFSEIFPR